MKVTTNKRISKSSADEMKDAFMRSEEFFDLDKVVEDLLLREIGSGRWKKYEIV